MGSYLDIEEDYETNGVSYESLTDRAFSKLYFIEPSDGGHYRLLVHSNKICLLTLAPSHPIISEDLVITSINYQANDKCNRLSNKAVGKKKSGAQTLTNCSILCTIQCRDRKQPFVVRSNLVAKLIEMNEDIASKPHLLKDLEKGYIAIVFPKISDFDRELGRWTSEEEYLATVKSFENVTVTDLSKNESSRLM